MGKNQLKNVWLFVHTMMMADCPATGRYPKIGTVTGADLSLLAQCVPNKSRVRFRKTTVIKAQKKFHGLMKGLDRITQDELSWF